MRELVLKGMKKKAVFVWQCMKRRLPIFQTIKTGLWLHQEMGQPYSFAVVTDYVKNPNKDTFLLNKDYKELVRKVNGGRVVATFPDGKEWQECYQRLVSEREGAKLDYMVRLYVGNKVEGIRFFLYPEVWYPCEDSMSELTWKRNGYRLLADEKGNVTATVYMDSYGFLTKEEKHRETGARFEGMEIPYLEEMKETTRKATELFPEISFMAWDFGVTAEGPVLLGGTAMPQTIADLQAIHYLYHGVGLRKEIEEMLQFADYKDRTYLGCGEGLAKHAEACLELPTIYMWGGLGQIITPEQIQEKAKIYPETYTEEYRQHLQDCVGKNVYGFDCSGLIKNYLMGGVDGFQLKEDLDYNAWLLLKYGDRSGTMDTLPEIRGVCLYMEGHVGIYVGNGRVIESTSNPNFGNGVVETKLTDRVWLRWFYCPHLRYEES